jgi:hypothetical protein
MRFLAIALGITLLGSNAFAQTTAKVQVTIKVPAKVASFKDYRLVVMLRHDHPSQDDRGLKTVDRINLATFSHTAGKDTLQTFTLGDKVKFNTEVNYSVSVVVFDAAGKRSHLGEKDGMDAEAMVLTNGSPDRVTMIVRKAD